MEHVFWCFLSIASFILIFVFTISFISDLQSKKHKVIQEGRSETFQNLNEICPALQEAFTLANKNKDILLSLLDPSIKVAIDTLIQGKLQVWRDAIASKSLPLYNFPINLMNLMNRIQQSNNDLYTLAIKMREIDSCGYMLSDYNAIQRMQLPISQRDVVEALGNLGFDLSMTIDSSWEEVDVTFQNKRIGNTFVIDIDSRENNKFVNNTVSTEPITFRIKGNAVNSWSPRYQMQVLFDDPDDKLVVKPIQSTVNFDINRKYTLILLDKEKAAASIQQQTSSENPNIIITIAQHVANYVRTCMLQSMVYFRPANKLINGACTLELTPQGVLRVLRDNREVWTSGNAPLINADKDGNTQNAPSLNPFAVLAGHNLTITGNIYKFYRGNYMQIQTTMWWCCPAYINSISRSGKFNQGAVANMGPFKLQLVNTGELVVLNKDNQVVWTNLAELRQ